MALGTPVITYNTGAANEIIHNSVTGFIVNGVEEAVQAISNLTNIIPCDCRDWVSTKFNFKRMNDQFLNTYNTL